MPETKGKTLEELDQVFSVPTHIHAAYGFRQIPYFFKRYLLRQHAEPERLYDNDDTAEDKDLGYDNLESHTYWNTNHRHKMRLNGTSVKQCQTKTYESSLALVNLWNVQLWYL